MTSSNQNNGTQRIDAALAEFMADFNLKRETPGQVIGIRTGFTDLDSHISGLRPGSLVVIAGRPSMGKSSFSLNIASHVALEQGLPVVIFSMELSGMQVAARILGQAGKFELHRLRTGQLEDKDWENLGMALKKFNAAEIYIDEKTGLNSSQICSRVRDFYAKHGRIGLVVVDYNELMDISGNNLREMMPSLKNLAQEVKAPVVVLSPLNRRLESRKNKRPRFSDLTVVEIANDADVVMFLYRDEVYYPDSPDKGTAEIIVHKHRWGPCGTVRLRFIHEYCGFENIFL